MSSRRDFLGRTIKGLGALTLAGSLDGMDALFGRPPLAQTDTAETILTVLHTNDLHSRIEPFPEGRGRNAGRAGAARRATLVRRIRKEAELAGEPRPLLLDAGDLFQGTPYFNLFQGKVDFEILKALEYDAMCIGNHDFDIGMDGLLRAIEASGIEDSFGLLNANYDVSNTILRDRVEPFIIRDCGRVRVGIFGLGIKLKG